MLLGTSKHAFVVEKLIDVVCWVMSLRMYALTLRLARKVLR